MKIILAISSLVMMATFTLVAQADTTSSGAVMQGPAMAPDNQPSDAMMVGNHPCRPIVDACKAAGFVRGGSKTGKGLYENCMKPILSGQMVNGVAVQPADIQACQAKHQARKNMN